MAIPSIESLKKEGFNDVANTFWMNLQAGEDVSLKTRIFLLCSTGEKIPWRRGEDRYMRHAYRSFDQATGKSFYRSILCGTEWGIQCPVCDLIKALQVAGQMDRVKDLLPKEDIVALILNMDEVDGKIPVKTSAETGEEEWVHALGLKPSIMARLVKFLIDDPDICSYESGAVLEISGEYPKGDKLRTKYIVDLEYTGRQVRTVTLPKDLIEKIEKRLDGNNLIASISRPFFSPSELFSRMAIQDQALLNAADYPKERPVWGAAKVSNALSNSGTAPTGTASAVFPVTNTGTATVPDTVSHNNTIPKICTDCRLLKGGRCVMQLDQGFSVLQQALQGACAERVYIPVGF